MDDNKPEGCENLSEEIDALMLEGRPYARSVQNKIKELYWPDGKIKTDKPLERILAIIEKHREEVLRKINPESLHAYANDKEGFVVKGECTNEYKAFTKEMLEAPDFIYTPKEASLIGKYYLGIGCRDNADFAIDRILLRKALSKILDPNTREIIWYTLTLHSNNHDSWEYLEKRHTQMKGGILMELEGKVLPEYRNFLESLQAMPDDKFDYGININWTVARMRQMHIESIIVYDDFMSGRLRF